MDTKRKNSEPNALFAAFDFIMQKLTDVWDSDIMDFLRFAVPLLIIIVLLLIGVIWGIAQLVHFPTYEERLALYNEAYEGCIQEEAISTQSCEEIARYRAGLGD